MLRQKLQTLRDNVRVFGLVATLRSVLAHALAPSPADGFDRRHGVRTAGVVEVEDSDLEGPAREHAIRYQPIDARVLRHMLATLPIDHARFAFVDLGSGLGRAVLAAAEYPFARVVGVELSAAHCRVAEQNLAAWRGARRCADVRIVQGDAASFEVPELPLVLYLFNPFQAPVLRAALERVRASVEREPREVWLAYCNPTVGTAILAEHGFERVSETRPIQPWWSWSLWRRARPDRPRG